jgi:hypothetical protein
LYFKEIRRSIHFDQFHKATLSWSDIVTLVHASKRKRKKNGKLEIEENGIYLLGEIRDGILYIINVKIK